MFGTARLRLTLWYLAILALIVGLLSFALYHILVRFPPPDVPGGPLSLTKVVAILASIPNQVLAWQIVAVDLSVLILAALGAYVLAGRTLQPIATTMARQQYFAAAASHELRTPLTALRGTMEVALLRRRTPEEYEQVLAGAIAEVERMSSLVTDLLAVVRAERESEALHPELLDLRDVVRAVVEGTRVPATAKRLAFEVALDGPLLVLGDPTQLRQAVATLVDNAVDYTPAGGTIRVASRRVRGRAVLEVEESGPGIAPEHLPHLFEPFYRVDATRDRGAGHLGLGLALAAWIVRAHKGRLGVASHLGQGTIFTLAVPLLPEA
jgi:two-component system, OmpR family, sensor histidine kinase CiaH